MNRTGVMRPQKLYFAGASMTAGGHVSRSSHGQKLEEAREETVQRQRYPSVPRSRRPSLATDATESHDEPRTLAQDTSRPRQARRNNGADGEFGEPIRTISQRKREERRASLSNRKMGSHSDFHQVARDPSCHATINALRKADVNVEELVTVIQKQKDQLQLKEEEILRLKKLMAEIREKKREYIG
jgi:hypothetical protein